MSSRLKSITWVVFCYLVTRLTAGLWFTQPVWQAPKAGQPLVSSLTSSSRTICPAQQVNLPGTNLPTLATIQQAQLTRLNTKKAQILQAYGVTEAQLDCQNPQNQQILQRAYSHNLQTDQFLASAEQCLAGSPGGCLAYCFTPDTQQLIQQLIQTHQVAPDQLTVGSCHSLVGTDTKGELKMFAYCSALTPGKYFLGINTDSYLVRNLHEPHQTVSYRGHTISCQLLFNQLIGHELCHIKHQDNLAITLLSSLTDPKTGRKIDPVVYEAFCEERADITGVLNCPDPLAVAEYLQDNCATGLYSYRNSPEWSKLIADLRACQNL